MSLYSMILLHVHSHRLVAPGGHGGGGGAAGGKGMTGGNCEEGDVGKGVRGGNCEEGGERKGTARKEVRR